MCYRDKTFCTAKCTKRHCNSKLTDQIKQDAVSWWGDLDAPIATADFSNSCEDFQKDKT